MAFSTQRPGSGFRPLADINVTPLVDVMLVLLIVFMITAPMLAQGLKVNLPQAKAAQTINPKDPIVISITREGHIAVGVDEIELPDLVGTILGKADGDLTRLIQVRADKDASYGALIGVLDQLSTNGLVHIALVSDPKARAGEAPAAVAAAADASIAGRGASAP
jgi:biopolymer transport protein TolR